jgi:hypothetical protein
MGRLCSGVGGVLTGQFAVVLSRFCGPVSCNMSFRDAHPRIGTSTHLYKNGQLFRNISLVYGKPTCLEKGEIFGITELYRYESVVSGCLSGFWDISRYFELDNPSQGSVPSFGNSRAFINSSGFVDNPPSPEMSHIYVLVCCFGIGGLFRDLWVIYESGGLFRYMWC